MSDLVGGVFVVSLVVLIILCCLAPGPVTDAAVKGAALVALVALVTLTALLSGGQALSGAWK